MQSTNSHTLSSNKLEFFILSDSAISKFILTTLIFLSSIAYLSQGLCKEDTYPYESQLSNYKNPTVESCRENKLVKGILIYIGQPHCAFCSIFLENQFQYFINTNVISKGEFSHIPDKEKPYCIWIWELGDWDRNISELNKVFSMPSHQGSDYHHNNKVKKPQGTPYFIMINLQGEIVQSWFYTITNTDYFWQYYAQAVDQLKENQ